LEIFILSAFLFQGEVYFVWICFWSAHVISVRVLMPNNSMQRNSHCPLGLAASLVGLFGQFAFQSIRTVAVADLSR
jgi:hypothetical protein